VRELSLVSRVPKLGCADDVSVLNAWRPLIQPRADWAVRIFGGLQAMILKSRGRTCVSTGSFFALGARLKIRSVRPKRDRWVRVSGA
jgi:hypothetical protein